jgi:multidrug efflux pump subunit AcrA (membrane-fusion protein)
MKRPIAGLLLSLLLWGCKSGDKADTKPVVNVSVQKAVTANVPLSVSAPASISGKSEAHISARITATVQRLLVHKGEMVKKGQLLAVLDQRDLAAQRADAAAAVSSSEAQLQRTQSGTIPAQLTQVRGELNARTAALDLAQKVYDRRKQLFAQGAISGRELQISESDLAQAKANYEMARVNLDVMEKHTNAEDLRMAQNSLSQSRAREELAIANLSFAELRSPFDGTVTEQFVFPGDLASPGTAMFTVVDLSSAVARAQVNADNAAEIKTGQACSFSVSDTNNTSRFGKVTVVNQAVDPARRTIEVWCEIPNQDHVLKAGLFGAAKIAIGQASNAIVLPASAVEFEEGTQQAKVFIVDEHHIAHLREVKAVALDDGRVRIFSGVRPGEVVITAGEYGLPDGTEVNPASVSR